MRVVKTNQAGQLLKSELKAFGGAYNLWEKFVNNGVGSSKVIYDEGLEVFDDVDRGVMGEIRFVSFELLRDGLLLRLNQNQRKLCLGVELSEIEAISLTGFRIEIGERKYRKLRTRIVHRGELTISERQGAITSFSVVTQEFETINNFFGKSAFTGKFNFSISDAPPEKDYSYLATLFG